ncbi:Rrf2 family transcriptional regulator [Rhizobium sp. BE258]|uniref:Rrf2 family transcriptional regulator n=1 Tax=Rhizobium sp. BE258 TaxID=2817722 RepID=UPI000DD94838|nr:Rrf2 family transcriptional regulator [Rhizobium sp. BE258]MDR7145019.1 DNA-binding IscR family transcriptional regulator [Rhizobium sp. BE258]
MIDPNFPRAVQTLVAIWSLNAEGAVASVRELSAKLTFPDSEVIALTKALASKNMLEFHGDGISILAAPSEIPLVEVYAAVTRNRHWLETTSVVPNLDQLLQNIEERAQQALIRELGSRTLADVIASNSYPAAVAY